MGQAQINVRTRACSRTSIARTKQAALTHNVRGKELTFADIILQIPVIQFQDYYRLSWTINLLFEARLSFHSITRSINSEPVSSM